MADTPARFLTRRSRLDKERALGTARNPGDSKYGNALYKNNAKENKVFSAELHRIERQLKRTSMHIDQEKKQFLQKHSHRDPMLIVVRPPSPLVLSKTRAQQYEGDGADYHSYSTPPNIPRYMKQTKSMARTTTTTTARPTIDAFCLKTKKKVNIWEEILLEKEKPSFRSTIMPSWPLTTSEVDDLVLGMEYHKNVLGHQGSSAPPQKAVSAHASLTGEQQSSGKRRSKKSSPITPTTGERKKRNGSQWRFVTELPFPGSKSEQKSLSTEKHTDRRGNGRSQGNVDASDSGMPSDDRSFNSQENSNSHKNGIDHDDGDTTIAIAPEKVSQKEKESISSDEPIHQVKNKPKTRRMELNSQTAITVVHQEDSNTYVSGLPILQTKPPTDPLLEETSHPVLSQQDYTDTKLENVSADSSENLTSSSENSAVDNIPGSTGIQNKPKCGLEVILEAAIEGLET